MVNLGDDVALAVDKVDTAPSPPEPSSFPKRKGRPEALEN